MATIITDIEKTRDVRDETGEIIAETTSISTSRSYPSDEPEFVKLYVKAWCAFKDVKSVNTAFLYELLPFMTFANDEQAQVIGLTPYYREKIGIKLGWSAGKDGRSLTKRFSNELNKLCKSGILAKLATNTYQVNPELVGKGYWSDIKALRATFNVIGERAGTVDVSIENEDRSKKNEVHS